jgi:microcystin-dependent protein
MYDQAPLVAKGKSFAFWPHIANTGAATININNLGAVLILRPDGTPLIAGDMATTSPAKIAFNGTQYVLANPQKLSGTNISGTIPDTNLPATLSSKTIDGSLTLQNGQMLIKSVNPIVQLQETDNSDKNWFVVLDGGNLSIRENSTANTRLLIENGSSPTSLKMDGQTVWTSGNDGVGSGLDADLLDGRQGDWYRDRANHTGTQAVNSVEGLQAIIDSINNALAINTPTGSIVIWPHENPPAGYLICNGQAVSRTTYSKLFSLIGGYYGVGNGSTTFNVPDFRGLFVRGKDNGRGLDPNRALGSYQDSDNKWHGHGVNDPGHNHGGVQNGTASTGRSTAVDQPPAVYSYGYTWHAATGISIQGSGGDESRPRNIAMNYIIKV